MRIEQKFPSTFPVTQFIYYWHTIFSSILKKIYFLWFCWLSDISAAWLWYVCYVEEELWSRLCRISTILAEHYMNECVTQIYQIALFTCLVVFWGQCVWNCALWLDALSCTYNYYVNICHIWSLYSCVRQSFPLLHTYQQFHVTWISDKFFKLTCQQEIRLTSAYCFIWATNRLIEYWIIKFTICSKFANW